MVLLTFLLTLDNLQGKGGGWGWVWLFPPRACNLFSEVLSHGCPHLSVSRTQAGKGLNLYNPGHAMLATLEWWATPSELGISERRMVSTQAPCFALYHSAREGTLESCLCTGC